MNDTILEAVDLTKVFTVKNSFGSGKGQSLRAVDGVSLTVRKGEIVGVVGESGCGKSSLGRCLLKLSDPTSGTLKFEGRDITRLSSFEMRPLRPRMQMVFQDPYASLNPRRRVRDIITEPLRVHRKDDGTRRSSMEIAARLDELIDLVGLSPDHLQRFPHEFSGGQRQRIGIARALALNPALIVADESVSALDVSVQAQIVNLFMDLQEKLGIACIFISHDLSVIRQISSVTVVMYLGKVVEQGPTEQLFSTPAHPYSNALLSAVPVPHGAERQRDRMVLTGDVPSPLNPPSGCRFRSRCPKSEAICAREQPELHQVRGQMVACHFPT